MTQVVHVQTTVQTVFGMLDDDGNVIPQQPIEVRITKLAAESFVEAHEVIAKARDDAAKQMDAEAEAPKGGEPPDAEPGALAL